MEINSPTSTTANSSALPISPPCPPMSVSPTQSSSISGSSAAQTNMEHSSISEPSPGNGNCSNSVNVRGQIFELGPRYIRLAYIGEGAYGMVVYVFLKISFSMLIELLDSTAPLWTQKPRKELLLKKFPHLSIRPIVSERLEKSRF